MSVWGWTGFFSCGASRSVPVPGRVPEVYIHLFPVGNGVSAPYPVEASVSLFAAGRLLGKRSFDGLRINQPDGVDLADVFPDIFRALKEGTLMRGAASESTLASKGLSSSASISAVSSAESLSGVEYEGGADATSQSSSSSRWDLKRWRSSGSLFGASEQGGRDAENGALAQRGATSGSLPHNGSESLDTRIGEIGIAIQLSTSQSRVDLSRSRVIIEVRYPSHTLRYHAVQNGHGHGLRNKDFLLSEEVSLYPHESFESQLVEVNSHAFREDSLCCGSESSGFTVSATEIAKGYLPNSGGTVSPLGFEPAGRLPRALPEEGRGQELKAEEESESEEGVIARFLVRYESASSLPVSVRCL
ncbi:MAG: hypothetical protein ACO3XO_06070 [Bdellovibrionota bacterium]